MRAVLALALLALADIASAQTVVTVPAKTVTIQVPAQTVTVPARTVSVTIPASALTIPASTMLYTVPAYQLTVGGGTTTPPPPPPPPPQVTGNCGLTLGGTVTFCDTFDKPFSNGVRTGQLDGNVWGVSRTIGDVNIGQGNYNAAPATSLVSCNGTTTVRPPNDVIVCNGQVREATNDNPSNVYDAGGVTALAMYPKQPFDFAGRAGTVAFDVSNDTHGNHAAWPEFWISDLPVPVPFTHFDSWIAFPQNGLGIRFAASALAGQGGLCPNQNNLSKRRWTVDSGVVIRNYAYEDDDYQGTTGGTHTGMQFTILDCVIQPDDNSGVTNHVEVRVSQNQIDVYATDAGVAPSAATLKHIATFTNANLSFTRGLIWMEDVHYNADKGESGPSVPSQRQHTFVWDNVAFDGPFTYRDFSYDAPDANQSGPANSTWNLGKYANPNQLTSWSIANVPANPQVTAVRVLFNFHNELQVTPTKLNVTVNGHAHSVAWPYPDKTQNTWRTYAVTVPVTDLVSGTNAVQIGTDSGTVVSNVNIVLVDVADGVPVLPGTNNAYPN